VQAHEAYEEALQYASHEGLEDRRDQAVIWGHLGDLALEQRDYAKAQLHHTESLEFFQALDEPKAVASAWHQLGRIAQEQNNWVEAERCYRESLAIRELLGEVIDAASTCNQLAVVARRSGRFAEAEGWLRRLLELDERIRKDSALHAGHLSNFAYVLLSEVQAGHIPIERLTEARKYAEQALAIRKKLDASSQIWMTLSILAQIADLQGKTEEARDYRRQEHETYAAFSGNRSLIDQQYGRYIAAMAAAAQGDLLAQAEVVTMRLGAEASGWQLAALAHRIIWEGKRDWHFLTEDIRREPALLILRVLETLSAPTRIRDR
jgi:tetratricopeptide (TPR) repeat protein